MNVRGMISKSKHTVNYPDLPSAMRPVPLSEEWDSHWKFRLLMMIILILIKITDSKKGTIMTEIQHLKHVVPHLNSI
jgi:hypothetical protein